MWHEVPLSRMKGLLREELREGEAERPVEGDLGRGSERAKQAWYSWTGASGTFTMKDEGEAVAEEGLLSCMGLGMYLWPLMMMGSEVETKEEEESAAMWAMEEDKFLKEQWAGKGIAKVAGHWFGWMHARWTLKAMRASSKGWPAILPLGEMQKSTVWVSRLQLVQVIWMWEVWAQELIEVKAIWEGIEGLEGMGKRLKSW